jgi:UDP-3-O-[3-hydroxymyristoyl] glucosamine N-acyltransferase
MRVALFGVGSPITLDVIESAERAGWDVAYAVRNVPGPSFHDPVIPVVEADDPAWIDLDVVVPLFGPDNRRIARDDAVRRGARHFPALIDPTSVLPRRVTIADGVYINAGCVLGAAAVLGAHAFVNRGARLGHHLALGKFASIGPGAVIAGQVTIGAGALIGAGAVIGPGVVVGAKARIGAGVFLRADVPDGATVIRQADTP